jgi:hypothetical protein
MRKVFASIAVAAAALVLTLAQPDGAAASCKTCEQGVTECMVCTLGCSDGGYCGSSCVSNSCGHCGVGECGGSSECSCSGVEFDALAGETFDGTASAAIGTGGSTGPDVGEVSALRFASADGRDVSRRLCDASITERHYTEDAVSALLHETRQIAL